MILKKNIKINKKLYNFINKEVLKDIKIDENKFWNGFSDIVDIYYPKNISLLEKRKNLQDKINKWHKENKSKNIEIEEYKNFLKEMKINISRIKRLPKAKGFSSILYPGERKNKTYRKNMNKDISIASKILKEINELNAI